ncbi:prorelaxin-like [Marmota monax]|uniref:prorelaxin-like n=1 Tax=Marmota monax TaxID=9995 RepID=UPI001EB02F8B|nr:prorelaxin-like [Marmota monax]
MTILFLSYLLGVWLLLGQFPSHTTADSLKHLSRNICTIVLNRFQDKCMAKTTKGSGVLGDKTLQEVRLSERPAIFSHRDMGVLVTLSEINPNFPVELKKTLSDTWSLLRDLQHPKDRDRLLQAFTHLCCYFNCFKNIKKLICVI